MMFVDLKAAFDTVDKEVLTKKKREKGIREKLVERVEEVIRKTKNRVGVGRIIKEEFWMARRMRQECPLSSLLFNIYC